MADGGDLPEARVNPWNHELDGHAKDLENAILVADVAIGEASEIGKVRPEIGSEEIWRRRIRLERLLRAATEATLNLVS